MARKIGWHSRRERPPVSNVRNLPWHTLVNVGDFFDEPITAHPGSARYGYVANLRDAVRRRPGLALDLLPAKPESPSIGYARITKVS